MKKRDNKTFRVYSKLLKDDRDWDFSYLLSLEKKKISRMFDYFSRSKISTSDLTIAKELSLCLRLLDIISGDDWATKEYISHIGKNYWITSEKDENGKSVLLGNIKKVSKFPVHVNYRNESRFSNGKRTPLTDSILALSKNNSLQNQELVEMNKENLRKEKALYLYNKVRAYKMWGWWN